MKKYPGIYRFEFQSAEEKNVRITGSRSSLDIFHDDSVVSKAMMFDDAQRRGVGVHINVLVPRWKAALIRLLGVK